MFVCYSMHCTELLLLFRAIIFHFFFIYFLMFLSRCFRFSCIFNVFVAYSSSASVVMMFIFTDARVQMKLIIFTVCLSDEHYKRQWRLRYIRNGELTGKYWIYFPIHQTQAKNYKTFYEYYTWSTIKYVVINIVLMPTVDLLCFIHSGGGRYWLCCDKCTN